MYRIAISALMLGLFLASCASSSGARSAPNREYDADISTTIRAVGEALLNARLNVEGEQWIIPQTVYEIAGYEQAHVYNSGEGPIRTANILVTVESIEGGKTKVSMKSTRNRLPAMASSAGQSVDHMREFFEQLDGLLIRN